MIEILPHLDRKEYLNIHSWLRYNYGLANKCENPECKHLSSKFEWSLKEGHEYKKDRNCFYQLCQLCKKKTREEKILPGKECYGCGNEPVVSLFPIPEPDIGYEAKWEPNNYGRKCLEVIRKYIIEKYSPK